MSKRQSARELERVENPKRHAARLRAEARSRRNCPIIKAQDAFFVPIQSALNSFSRELDSISQQLAVNREELRIERLKRTLDHERARLEAADKVNLTTPRGKDL